MTRFILTGAPGSGKTSILHALRDMGFAVVEEAATAVIALEQGRGNPAPWTEAASFIDAIVATQRERQRSADASRVRFFDRSPVCTHALAVYLGCAIPAALHGELERIAQERVYDRRVFFVRNLGFCERTPARQISYADSLEFEQVHVESYRGFGYELVDVPPLPLEERVIWVRDRALGLANR